MFFPKLFCGNTGSCYWLWKGGWGWKERSFLCVCVCWRGKEKEEEEEGNGHYGEFMGAFVRLKINLISAPHFAEPPTPPTPPPPPARGGGGGKATTPGFDDGSGKLKFVFLNFRLSAESTLIWMIKLAKNVPNWVLSNPCRSLSV